MLQKGNQNKTDETIVQKLEDGIKRSLGLEDGIRAAGCYILLGYINLT